MTVLIVTGGRTYDDTAEMTRTLHPIFALGEVVLVVGRATGADTIAEDIAKAWNAANPTHRVEIVTMPITQEERRVYGNYAGNHRNGRMVRYAWDRKDSDKRFVAVRGGSGTADCAERCRQAGFRQMPVAEVSL